MVIGGVVLEGLEDIVKVKAPQAFEGETAQVPMG